MKKIILMMLFIFMYAAAFSQKNDTITTSSGLKYLKLKEGKGAKPKDGQKLKVKYTGKLMNGKKFDSGTYEFVLGKKEVIPGWDEGFKLMQVGEKGIMIVPSKLGYGKKGSKDDDGNYVIPPDADMIFEVTLLGIN